MLKSTSQNFFFKTRIESMSIDSYLRRMNRRAQFSHCNITFKSIDHFSEQPENLKHLINLDCDLIDS